MNCATRKPTVVTGCNQPLPVVYAISDDLEADFHWNQGLQVASIEEWLAEETLNRAAFAVNH